MNKLLASIAILLSFSTSFADDKGVYVNDWIFKRIIDGDTLVFIAPSFPEPLSEISIRVYGIDTPESTWRAECETEKYLGLEAKKYVTLLVEKSTLIEVEVLGWGKYGGRALGNIYLNGQSLRTLLIENKYAVPYFGDKKESWCK